MRTNLHHLLEEQARNRGAAPALTFKDDTLDYARVWGEAGAFAGGLLGLGLARSERVAVFLDKRPETVVAIFGTSAAGGVFVPVNPVLKGPQVAHILADCDVRVLVTTRPRLALLADELGALPALKHVILVPDPQDRGADGDPIGAPEPRLWDDLLAAGTGDVEGHRVVDLDMGAILYTSGSTGKPKGVVLSHRNLIVGAESVSSYLENTADDVILSALPLSFDAGLSQVTTAFSVGAHVVLMNYLLPKDVVRLCGRHGVTGLTCVPPLWSQIADVEWPAGTADTVRYFANTGGRMPKQLLDRLRERMPAAAPYLMYGLTEAFRSTYLPPDQVDRRPDSIGKAIPNAEILVVAPDGRLCGPGEEGELVHRGALVALGYWGDAARTAERFKPVPGEATDWAAVPEIAVWSGDTVKADEEGYLYFVGRKDDMIKTSGYRVSPTELEEVAYDSGLVGEAAAIGVPDERLGERVVLVVAPKDPASFEEAALLASLRATLPLFMVPGQIDVRDQLPRSPNGKFDRNLIRTQVRDAG